MGQGGRDQKETGTGTLSQGIGERVAADIERLMSRSLAPGLYLVATPIGNLADVTLRALVVLSQADVVYCEDTRHSGVLLAHFGVRAVTHPYNDHNAEAQRPRVLADLAVGRRVALISDAGTPLVSDPGFKLVREAAAAGHAVIAIPGASATLTALVASGLPTDSFHFAGFLPAKSAARRTRIAELAAVPGTLVLFEAPQRVGDALADLAGVLGARPGVVARELTKLHEEILRGPLAELAAAFAAREVKGEVVVLVGPPAAGEVADETIEERLIAHLEKMSLRDAAKSVADALGVPKSRVYDLAIGMKRERQR